MLVNRSKNGSTRRFPWHLLLPVLAVVTLFHVLVLATYPVLIRGDGPTYYWMLTNYHSSLVHASGYVLFMAPVTALANLLGAETFLLLPITQHLIFVVGLVAFFAGIVRILRPGLAAIVVGLVGLDPIIASRAQMIGPEWLQVVLLGLLMASVATALTAKSFRSTCVWAVVAGALCAAGYVTKYNAVVAGALLLPLLLHPRLGRRQRVYAMLCAAVSGVVVLTTFVFGFHRPTTGTATLNLEHGYIYMEKLEYSEVPILPGNGSATQKYLTLVGLLPQTNPNGLVWNSVDWLPDRFRRPFRDEHLALLNSDDPLEIRRAFDSVVGDRLPPEGGSGTPEATSTVYVHLGLFEAERLYKRVFLEGVSAHPLPYAAHVSFTALFAPWLPLTYQPYTPTPWVDWPLRDFRRYQHPAGIRAPVLQPTGWEGEQNKAVVLSTVWWPGAAIFALVYWAMLLVTQLAVVLLPINACRLALIWKRRQPTLDASAGLLLAVLAALAGAVVFSALIYYFRTKELIFCLPLLAMGNALAWQLLGKWRGALAPD